MSRRAPNQTAMTLAAALLVPFSAPAAPPSPAEDALLLQQANASYAARRSEDAVDLYREYLARYRDRADVRVFLGAALLNLGSYAEALAEVRRAQVLDPGYARAFTLAGRVHAARQDWGPAGEAFREALRLAPQDRESWYFYGRALYDEGRCDRALAAFEKALRLGAGQSRVHEYLGLSLEALARYPEAEKAFLRALDLGPEESGPSLAYGAFLTKQGRPAQAVPFLEKALRLDPASADARFELAKALLQSDQLPAAARILEQAPALPCRARYLLQTIYRRQGRDAEAGRQAEKWQACRDTP